MIALAWVIFAAVVLGITAFCWLITRRYVDKQESEWLPTIVTVAGLTVVLLCVFLIPVDIYNVSTDDSPEDKRSRSESIKILYYTLYGLILVFSFGLIPFAYFYYEEEDENVSTGQRIWGGCKYTIFVIVIVAILLIVGLCLALLSTPGDKPTKSENTKEWIKYFKKQSVVEDSISFCMACLTCIGYITWLTYTAYGLSAFPIGFIKGRRNVKEELSNVRSDLESTKQRSREVRTKYMGRKNKMSKKDESTLRLLERKERILSKRNKRLEESNSIWNKILIVFRPFKFVFGIIFFLISLLIVVSMLLTSIDKAVNSTKFCGSKCGFVLAYPKIFNPLDTMLTKLSSFFPLDYVLIGGLVIYIFFATLSGITRIGVRFLWINMYKIRPGSSMPQGMLLASAILMFSLLALNMEISTLAPQYSTWGSQTYYDTSKNSTEPCSWNADRDECVPTEIGIFASRLFVRASFFGYVFFIATWVFLLTWLIGLIVAVVKGKPSNIETREDDSDEEEF